MPISSIIKNSRFLASKIYSFIALKNNIEEDKEILFSKLQANIIIDLARTISKENRYFNILMVCGLASALYYLKIPYSLSLIGDSDLGKSSL